MAKRDTMFRGSLLLLLTSILIAQCLALREMHLARPPTLGDLRTAEGDARQAVILRRPLVHVSGSVSVD